MLLHNLSRKILPTDDYSKMLLWLPKLFLDLVWLWPENNNKRRKRIVIGTFLCLLLFVGYGLVFYTVENFKDLNKSTIAISSLSNVFQGTTKTIMIYHFSGRLKSTLKDIWKEFWPSTIDADLHEAVKNRYQLVLRGILTYLATVGLFLFGVLLMALISGGGNALTFKAVYQFNYNVTPMFEIVLLSQSVTHNFIIPLTALGFDFLFYALCFTVMSQYLILGRVFVSLGTPDMEKWVQKIYKGKREDLMGKRDVVRVFFKMCVRQHQLLLRTTREIENIFNMASFFELYGSVVAICMSAFIVSTNDTDADQAILVCAYLSAYFLQLAMYCSFGNELHHQANLFSEDIFGSKWYATGDIGVEKDFLFMLRGAQLPVKMTAFKFRDLNYPTFISVLRLSFSFFTLLTTVADK